MAVNFYNGYIADTPATPSSPVRVSVPNLTQMDRVVYGPLPWQPLTNSNGDTIWPTLGDKCLIADDDSVSGAQWIVSWSGSRVLTMDGMGHSHDITGIPVKSIGNNGSKRGGRKLTVADFTTLLGIATPIALYNFDGSFSDSSGNARDLTPTTAAPTFGSGINGVAAEAARFVGNNAMALFTADGNGGPFNFRTGSFGCWFKTAKVATSQRLISKGPNVAGSRSWMLSLDAATNTLKVLASPDGTAVVQSFGNIIVGDDCWHFGVGTYDGSMIRLYVDAQLDARTAMGGDFAQTAQPFNIGSAGVTAVAGTGSDGFPMFGLIDEAFVHPEVLIEDQIRLLMAATVPHGLSSAPVVFTTKVRRRRRGGPLSPADFPTPPRRLYNFTNTSVADQGLDAATLSITGAPTSIDGVDGTLRDAKSFPGTVGNYFSVAAPAAFTASARSVGCWFQTVGLGAQMTVLALSGGTASDWRPLYIQASGVPATWDGTAVGADGGIAGNIVNCCDGLPHFWLVVWDNAAVDGLKRKAYLDSRLVGSDTSFTTPTIGTGQFFIGQTSSSEPYKGLLDGLFVCDYALTAEQQASLFAVGSKALGAAMFDNSIIEAADATNLYLLANYLDPQHLIDIRAVA